MTIEGTLSWTMFEVSGADALGHRPLTIHRIRIIAANERDALDACMVTWRANGVDITNAVALRVSEVGEYNVVHMI